MMEYIQITILLRYVRALWSIQMIEFKRVCIEVQKSKKIRVLSIVNTHNLNYAYFTYHLFTVIVPAWIARNP